MSYPYQIKSFEEYKKAYQKSIESPEEFWGEIAHHFLWKKKWNKVLDWNFKEPTVQWFIGGQLNITENCLDRHLPLKANDIALLWEPNNPKDNQLSFTYQQVYDQVCYWALVLKKYGVKKGDRVCIYMGMIPELAFAMLACARVGAIHSIIFGGFSAHSIKDRVLDAHATYILTVDGGYRANKIIELKHIVDEAIADIPFVNKVIVAKRTGYSIAMNTPRDIWFDDEVNEMKKNNIPPTIPAETMDAEDTLFILYTSGSTGKPKGVLHTCGGYMIYTTYTFVNVFQYQPGDIHFCTADIGWITGHSYTVYAPLCAGAISLMFEGIPTYPGPDRFWDIIDTYKVNSLYTAPTSIRSLMTFGLQPFEGKSLQSLKLIGTVGEPINEEAWNWYNTHVGKNKCPIVDTWFQTETAGILISNLAGITPQKPTFATLPMPGIHLMLVNEQGHEIKENNAIGNLCVCAPWPSILRTTYGDHERCRLNYFSTYNNMYFTGDGAYRDKDGFYRITGRVDDVLNISGHRIGTAELENACNKHPLIIESAVVGFPHDIKGQGIYLYVVTKMMKDKDSKENVPAQIDIKEILHIITEEIGAFAKPDKIQLVIGLPKTRSGKIMRRILRKIAEGQVDNMGDTSTLIDPSIVSIIAEKRII